MTYPGLALARAKFAVVEKHREDESAWQMFIIGKSTAAIRTVDPNSGKPAQDVAAVMTTLYEQHRLKPELAIDRRLQGALLSELRTPQTPTYLRNAVETLVFQLNAEQQGTAPFRIDSVPLLEALREQICRNRPKYEAQELRNFARVLQEQFDLYVPEAF